MRKIILLSSCVGVLLTGCMSVNESDTTTKTRVSFAKGNETAAEQTTVEIKFSEPTMNSGTISLTIEEENLVYGTDYTLSPEKSGDKLVIPFEKNASSVNFTFKKLTNNPNSGNKSVTFTLSSVSDNSIEIAGITKTVISYEAIASQGGSVHLNVGGSTLPNQSFLKLSDDIETSVRRDKWELAFYNGDKFRVKINGAIRMAVKKLNTTDITASVSPDPNVAVGTLTPENLEFIDVPSGNLEETAIEEISDNPNQNHVYLVNMGTQIPNTPAEAGSVNASGAPRGWMKIKIDRANNGYKLKYAPINSAEFSEVTITKNATYNFSFFSMTTNSLVEVEPAKAAWDIQYTMFTNELGIHGSYFFSDFIVINNLGGVKVYKIEGNNYDSFAANEIDENLFVSNDQRAIGASWRSVLPVELYTNIFYILKDGQNNYYKLRITQFEDPTSGERGYPVVEYQKL